MPNHVTNRIKAKNFDIGRFVEENADGKRFDFGKIVPCPDIVSRMGDVPSNVEMLANISLGLVNFAPSNILEQLETSNCINLLKSGKGVATLSDDDFELFVLYLRNYRETETVSNLDWNRKYWGTKWNAYELNVISADEITFETAWSAPHPVIEKMAEIVAGELLHEWADEDTGSNVGRRIYKFDQSGVSFSESLLDETKEGYELAFALNGNSERYKWDGESYVYRDDDESNE